MNDQISKHDQVLLSLVMNLQALSMVQLGKVTSPATGELQRDLEGARGTIDLLEMLKVKCRTDTPEPVLQMLDQAVMDLQMNYLDERKRRDAEGSPQAPEEATSDASDEGPAEDSGA